MTLVDEGIFEEKR